MNNFKAADLSSSVSLEEQFDHYCKEMEAGEKPASLGRQLDAWTTWMAWAEGDEGEYISFYSGRVADMSPPEGMILWRNLKAAD
jgi:hypothetical protein